MFWQSPVLNARLAHKVEPRLVDDCGLFQLNIRAEEYGGAEDPLESSDQPAVLGTALLHAECVQHFKGAGERDRAALLPDRQGGEENGNQAILSLRQPIGRMTGDLQEKLSVSAFVQQDTIGWPLDRQATKNKRPGSEPQGLAGGISLQPGAFNGLGLTELLLGYEDLARKPPQDGRGRFHGSPVRFFFRRWTGGVSTVQEMTSRDRRGDPTNSLGEGLSGWVIGGLKQRPARYCDYCVKPGFFAKY